MTELAEAVWAPAPTARAGRGSWRPAAICIVVYVLLGLITNYPAWLHDPGSWMTCGGCGDSGQEIWFLRWATFALTHLHDPLRTNWIDFPWGADLADNTAMPLVGIVTSPITLLFGPVASWNVMNVLAFASSATAAMFACRRWVRTWGAAFIGGLLYGFSPYMVGQGMGHLFLLLTFVPPLLLLLLHEIFIRQTWSWRRCGVLLAILLVVQLGISQEMLAEEALVAAVGAIVLWAARPDRLRAGWPHLWRSLALGIGLAVPFIAAVLVIGLTGPEHARGAIHPVGLLAGLSSDLLSPVVPTVNQHFNFGAGTYGTSLVALTPGGGQPSAPDVAENGAYIGIPLLLLLVIGTWRLRREALVRFSWLMALFSLLLSMGSRLHVGGDRTPIPLPFAVLTHLPLLKSEVAARYTLFAWLFLGLLAAVALDRGIRRSGTASAEGSPTRPRMRWRAGGAVLLILGLFALVPQWPYVIAPGSVPPWFSSSAVKRVPVGSTLLTYPYAFNTHSLPMFWQAVNGMRYRIPAGEVSLPVPHYTPVQAAFDLCWLHPSLRAPPRSLIAGARVILEYWQVRTVVVPFQYTINPSCAVRFLTAVLGRAPRLEHGAAAWRLRVRT